MERWQQRRGEGRINWQIHPVPLHLLYYCFDEIKTEKIPRQNLREWNVLITSSRSMLTLISVQTGDNIKQPKAEKHLPARLMPTGRESQSQVVFGLSNDPRASALSGSGFLAAVALRAWLLLRGHRCVLHHLLTRSAKPGGYMRALLSSPMTARCDIFPFSSSVVFHHTCSFSLALSRSSSL